MPVLQIGLSSNTLAEQQLNDLGMNVIRTQLATVQGASVPFPYGGKVRLVSVDIDSPALQAKGLSPLDVVNAVSSAEFDSALGHGEAWTLEYQVEMNGSTRTINELNDLPVKTANGATIYLRDVAHVRDGFSPQTNVVRQDGHRSALLSVYKTGSASTLAIVRDVRAALATMAGALPSELKLTPMFDQSLFVRAAIQGVIREASHGRMSDRGHDSSVLGELAQHSDYCDLDPALDSGFGLLPERVGRNDEPDDARRPRAGRGNSGRRCHG